MTLAMEFAPFWSPANGQTLCVPCHGKHHPNVKLSKTRR
jgi:hypothetical protein